MSLAAGTRKWAGTGRFALACTHPLDSLARMLLDVWPEDETLPDVRCTRCLGRFVRVIKISPSKDLTRATMFD